MKKQILAAAVLATISGTSMAQSLTEAIQTTLNSNPNILASRYNLEAAQHLKKQARGGYFPSVDLVLAKGDEESNNTTTRAAGFRELDLTRTERSIKVTQMLYDGFSTRSFVRQQEALVDAALSRLANSEENVALRAIQVYLESIRRSQVVELAEENFAQHDSTLEKIQERFDSGVGTRVDVVQTQGRRAQSRSNLLLSTRDGKNGDAQFYRVVGEYPNNLTLPQAIGGLPQTLDEALEIAYRNNPGIQAAQADLDATISGRQQARGAFHPRFDLEIGATRNDDTDGTIGANDDNTAVVRMTYNVFRGGSDRARINEAESREFAARETLRSVRRGVQEDVTLVWNELQDILERQQYLDAHVRSTEEVLDVYKEQLSLNKRTLLDLLDVQNELLRAKVAALSGRNTALLARYRVLGSTGRLLSTMGLSSGS